jgi:hypothetical protein
MTKWRESYEKKKRGFSQKKYHLQNPLSGFTQVSFFGNYKHIFTTHFSNLKFLEFLILVINFGNILRGDGEVF